MRRNFLSFLLASMAILLAGCSTLTSDVKPGVSLAHIRNVYVVQSGEGKRDINNALRVELRKTGLEATMGPRSAMPANADAYLTHNEQWVWDGTLTLLHVNLHHPKSNQVIASASRYTIVGKEPIYMARVVIAKMFGKPVPEG